jgi:hypothetical protein
MHDDWLTPEIALLIERSAELRRGLAFVNRAPVESVAVTLGVHPTTVDRARDCLAAPELRPSVIREFQRALTRRSSASPPPPAPTTKEEPDVLRDALCHPQGLEFVLRAPIETVAISFGVHPEEVVAARDELARLVC